MSFIYLASPYTDTDAEVRKQRQLDAELAAALFMRIGQVVYSPIAHGCAIDKHLPKNVSGDHGFWMKQCYAMLNKASAMYVLLLDDVSKSEGVKLEIIRAQELGLHITFWFKLKGDDNNFKFEFESQEVGFKAMGFEQSKLWQPIKD